MKRSRLFQLLFFPFLFLAVLAAYSNHFENSFQFDDSHAVVSNPAIRELSNVPRFFRDATTFSYATEGQSYRPIVSTSLALDYALGRGLKPFWFHLSTFFWFIVQLAFMYALYMFVIGRASPHPWNHWLAGLATAIYGLHPVSAETVNYIIQRGDLYATLGVVAGVVIYAWKPDLRHYGLYLIPPVLGMLSKPPAVIFAPILLAYVLIIERSEEQTSRSIPQLKRPVSRSRNSKSVRQGSTSATGKLSPHVNNIRSVVFCLKRCIPAFVVCGSAALLQKLMTPAGFFASTLPAFDYWITQPYVTVRYFRSFFAPLYLSADSDLHAFHSPWGLPTLIGLIFCGALTALAVVTARRDRWRAVSFGLWWFLLGLIPTAVFPLNEVENDHRMYLPFVGLSLAVVFTLWRVAEPATRGARPRIATLALSIAILAGFGWGTHRRNQVWHTPETLWRDVVQKSPGNPRGHFTLASILENMPGHAAEAMSEYQATVSAAHEALESRPDDPFVLNLLGSAWSRLPGHLAEAIPAYREAVRLRPNFVAARVNLADVLLNTGHVTEAIDQFREALRLDPNLTVAHISLGLALSQTSAGLDQAMEEYQAALRIKPDSVSAHVNLADALSQLSGRSQDAIAEYREALRIDPNLAVAHNNLGFLLSRIPGRESEAVSEYKAALRLNPNSAEAYLNLGEALAKVPGRLPEAIADVETALRFKPDPAIRQTLDRFRAARDGAKPF